MKMGAFNKGCSTFVQFESFTTKYIVFVTFHAMYFHNDKIIYGHSISMFYYNFKILIDLNFPLAYK